MMLMKSARAMKQKLDNMDYLELIIKIAKPNFIPVVKTLSSKKVRRMKAQTALKRFNPYYTEMLPNNAKDANEVTEAIITNNMN